MDTSWLSGLRWVADFQVTEVRVVQFPLVVQATIGWMVLFHDPDGLEIHLYSRDRGDLDNSGKPSFGRPAGG